jgi:hypothetical protein
VSLIAFLRARLAEDEQAAVATHDTELPWEVARDSALTQRTSPTHGYEMVPGHIVRTQLGTLRAIHIARHDPARVLREVEAKRRIIEWLVDVARVLDAREVYAPDADDGLRLLALPYVGHSDYREEWKP